MSKVTKGDKVTKGVTKMCMKAILHLKFSHKNFQEL